MTTIAEIGQAHDGSLGMLHAYIDALATTGVKAVKFQTHIAAAESSIHEPFRIKFSKQDATRFDYWKRMEFTQDQWNGIGAHCKEAGLTFISSPFSNAAVDVLEEAGVEIYKIGSGEVNNFLLLKKVIDTRKPIIISSGMSSYSELDKTVAFLKDHNVEFSILQCTTSYPTQPQQYGFNVITELKERYGVPVGFSDHSAKVATGIAAVALGASIIEFHVVFDKKQFGPDVTSSLTISEVKQLIDGVKSIDKALQNPVDKSTNDDVKSLKAIFEKSLAINKDLPKGHVLKFSDLEAKKPKGYGIDAASYKEVIGKPLKKAMQQWDFLNEADIAL
ncbi:N-acetylneuraminate synthase family protein [Patiriisocius hiemis]|uniref:N-acetylneuraminate synthase family protein n=1 Tax=Patiriisocius hiemis TaxID=3075604 RepID=A0ABU2YCZ9_9FLAO|nr:N-acetylneuraminate synthase family protein [Constantimarinum sp. W242]MDT0556041.1 N-acetylneuraminate synthase family protein [Constantimarinum sp. W242]